MKSSNSDSPPVQEDDEVSRLKVLLASREVSCQRLEGENFILGAQVQQLQQQLQEAARDAHVSQTQLSQAQQVLDNSVAGRMPMKTDVDHARALLATARRQLRRLAGAERGPPAPVPRLNNLRVAAANGTSVSEANAQHASASANPKMMSPRGQQRPSVGNLRAVPGGQEPRRRRSPVGSRVSTAGTGGTSG
eukprot:CAMPEP_0115097628 /NCGR_PEP_ID=MMETSP0227-20121206/30604_1 /TAXON_ID=89957 /ORGANISM="Polarella glacialis, Strain CCMP 1383" /LENGTH=191 /DNA_ID=CAMNT_0002491933 /DNA_START=20 /DNA_END=592 /DNA_ORIENTATION=-